MRLLFEGGLYSRAACIQGWLYCFGCNAQEGEVAIIIIRGKKHMAPIIFSREKCGFYSRAAYIKGWLYCFGCNAQEGEVAIIMIRGKKYMAPIIFSRENCGFCLRAASIRDNTIFESLAGKVFCVERMLFLK